MLYKHVKTGNIIDIDSVVRSDFWLPLEQKETKVTTAEKVEDVVPEKKTKRTARK